MPQVTKENLASYYPELLVRARNLHVIWNLPPSVDAEDLVQETLTKATQSLAPGESCELAWLRQILHNHAIDTLRRHCAGQHGGGKVQSLDAALAECSSLLIQAIG